MNTESLTAEKADMFEEGNIEAITRMMQNRKKNLLWLAVTSLMVFCLYWLSNVVLWVPWSHKSAIGYHSDADCKSRLLGSRHICLSGLRKWSRESDEESSSASLDCGRNIFAIRLSVFCSIHEVEGRMAHYHILWLCLVSCIGFG